MNEFHQKRGFSLGTKNAAADRDERIIYLNHENYVYNLQYIYLYKSLNLFSILRDYQPGVFLRFDFHFRIFPFFFQAKLNPPSLANLRNIPSTDGNYRATRHEF